MSQISFSDLVNGTIPDASDFNDRFNALKNRINNGMEADNIATGAITNQKLGANAVDASKLDETDDYTWTGTHDFSGASLTGAATVNGMLGSYKNLAVIRPTAATIDVDADFLIVWDSSNVAKLLSSVNLTIDITASGANGLDAGSENSGTWYYIWVIYNGTTVSGLLSTSSTSPTLPTGYTYKALVSAVRNDGSSDFIDFLQNGKSYSFKQNPTLHDAATVNTSWVSLDLSGFVPSALSNKVSLIVGGQTSGGTFMSNDSTVTPGSTVNANVRNRTYQPATTSANVQRIETWDILTADTLYVGGSASGYNVKIYVMSFEINKL